MALGFRSFKANVNDLRVPTVLEVATDTSDGRGGTVRTWSAQTGTIFVHDLPLLMHTFTEGGQFLVAVRHEVTMRYTAIVTSDDRWRFNGPFGIWYIQAAVDPLNDKHWLSCVCQETQQ